MNRKTLELLPHLLSRLQFGDEASTNKVEVRRRRLGEDDWGVFHPGHYGWLLREGESIQIVREPRAAQYVYDFEEACTLANEYVAAHTKD